MISSLQINLCFWVLAFVSQTCFATHIDSLYGRVHSSFMGAYKQTSLNITTLQAGVQVGNTYAYNCVPPTATCSLDIRISPHVPPTDIGNMLDQWCQECSKDQVNRVEWNFINGQGNTDQGHATTSTDPEQNPWYAAFTEAMSDMGLDFQPEVFPAATDSRFLRALGIRALGFSPMKNTEIMLHENDEYIPESEYLQGIQVYVGLLEHLASR